MELPYGNRTRRVPFDPQDFHTVLSPSHPLPPLDLPLALAPPLATFASRMRARKPRIIAVIVEDATRKNRELPAILSGLRAALGDLGAELRLVVGYGAHPAHPWATHVDTYGASNLAAYRLVDHDCRDEDRLIEVGRLSDGHPLRLCREAVEADVRILVGSIEPHVFAGFTGGRKMILPGIADYESIRRNHAKVLQPFLGLGNLEGNPIHDEMMDAARCFPIHFAIQLVRDAKGCAVQAFCGDLDAVFTQGVALCQTINTVRVDLPADLTVVTPGGAPKDASLYQANRAITAARHITRPGGTVLILGAFPDGMGSANAEAALRRGLEPLLATPPEAVAVGGHNAVCLARNLQAVRLVIESDWVPDPALGLCHARTLAPDLPHLWKRLQSECGPIRHLIPNGSCVVPVLHAQA